MSYKSVKELSEACNVSKSTIQRAVRDLGIKPLTIKNRHVFDEETARRIENYVMNKEIIPPQNKSETMQNESEESINASQMQNDAPSDSKRTSDDVMIAALVKQLEEKDKQIASLLEQNQLLTKSNAVLTLKLEDKTIVEKTDLEESSEEERPVEEKRSWFKILFGR